MTTNNVGACWTHIGPSQWYVDAVLMGSFYDADPRSTRGIGASMKGDAITASIETGMPFRITPYLSLETQGQLIWQHLRFDPTADPFTTLAFNPDDNLVGRFGVPPPVARIVSRETPCACATKSGIAVGILIVGNFIGRAHLSCLTRRFVRPTSPMQTFRDRSDRYLRLFHHDSSPLGLASSSSTFASWPWR
jgi:hypothetical protein